jgi:hypothetical protein
MPPEQADTSVLETGGTASAAALAETTGSAASNAVARLIELEEGFYAFTMAGGAIWAGAAPGFALPAVHISTPPDRADALTVTDIYGQPAAWLGARHATVFVKSPAGGAVALVTAFPARDPARPPVSLEIRRLDAAGFAEPLAGQEQSDVQPAEDLRAVRQPPLGTLVLADPVVIPASPEEVRVEIIAHVRGRGDVRFVEAPWAGRLGSGLWIESFSIQPRHRLAAAAIEYKGLTAAGMETEWLGSGSPCGTRGMNTPLIGFAVRQKAVASDVLFDCEYTGYFQSGATVGPCRNGAPCLSAAANDPLEGIQLRIVERPKRANSARPEHAPDLGRR